MSRVRSGVWDGLGGGGGSSYSSIMRIWWTEFEITNGFYERKGVWSCVIMNFVLLEKRWNVFYRKLKSGINNDINLKHQWH